MKTSRIRVGDHLIVQRLGDTHHGLYIGSDQVVHYISSLDGLVNHNKIGITSVSEFSQGYPLKIKLHDHPRYSPEEAADRACLQIGELEPLQQSHDSAQFVDWCLEGEPQAAPLQLTHTLEKRRASTPVQQQRIRLSSALKNALMLRFWPWSWLNR